MICCGLHFLECWETVSLPSAGPLSFPQVMVEWIDNWQGKREMLRQKPVLEPKWNMIREWGVLWRLWKPSHTKQSSLCLFTIFWEITYFNHRCYDEPTDLLQNV